MEKITCLILLLTLLAGPAGGRVWTSADGSKTFEGDFVSCTDKTITVKRGHRPMTIKLELLSEEDQKWAKAESARISQEEAVVAFNKSDFGKALHDLQKFDGTEFKKFELKNPPGHFLIYVAASTCGTCRKTAPELVETYNKDIASNPDLELIQLSRDGSKEEAEKWADSLKQPWPTLLEKDTDVETLIRPHFPNGQIGLPAFLLVDRDGKLVAKGKEAVFAAVGRNN